MKKYSLLICLIVMHLHCSNAEKEVRLVAGEHYPPYYSEKLPGKGFISQLITESFTASGYSVEVDYVPWARAIKSVKTGEYDGIFSIWYRKDRESWGAFSDPFFSNEIVLLKKKTLALEYESIQDLKGLSVGVIRGYSNPKLFRDAEYFTKEETSDSEHNLIKLERGRVDLILIDKMVGEYLMQAKKTLNREDYEWVGEPLEVTPQHIAFSKQVADYEAKRAAFNKGLKIIKENGVLDRILKESELFAADK